MANGGASVLSGGGGVNTLGGIEGGLLDKGFTVLPLLWGLSLVKNSFVAPSTCFISLPMKEASAGIGVCNTVGKGV